MSSETKTLSLEEAFVVASQSLTKATQEKDIDAQIKTLLEIRSKKVTSAALEANLGRAFYKKGDLYKATEHMSRAIELNRFESQYRSDLLLIQNKVPNGMGTASSHPSEWGIAYASYVKPSESFALASILGLVFAVLWFLKRPIKRAYWVTGSFVIFAFLLLGVFSQSSLSRLRIAPYEVSLKSAPLESSEEIMRLPAGTRLRVLRESGDFVEVEKTNSFRGWAKISQDAATKK